MDSTLLCLPLSVLAPGVGKPCLDSKRSVHPGSFNPEVDKASIERLAETLEQVMVSCRPKALKLSLAAEKLKSRTPPYTDKALIAAL